MNLPDPSADNRAVVTGASSGIGTALAGALARRGYHLVLIARRADRLRELADRLAREHGIEAEVRACDLGDRAAREELARELSGREIAVLCNNAGFATYGPLSAADPEREREEVELDVAAVHDLTQAVLPGMLDRKAGGILITGSTAGNQPGPLNATYAACKAFANTLAESLHTELKGTGVGCTLLAPGPVRTEFAEVAEVSKLTDMLPEALLVSVDRVAEQAIDGLAGGKRRVVPGPLAKAQTLLGTYGPRGLSGPVLRGVYRRAG
ncbi:SDR family NAD(P)-dependent oxidoreductase [Amycolatopsis panacis]|uniref:SDR family oxidoreductase n=1 Tax=Amycolatopsis panacis TaxID=2340917 RepID=A0A419HJD9_9PSEU|nr:SDR family oxidoreductase [Amycolatopsis panacis]RJQ75847.1 SDR family oxidoreductase [Amycolatopsis panacis]